MTATPDIPAIAAHEYQRRLRNARAAVKAGTMGRDQAEAAMRCWLVIACRARADLPGLRPRLAELKNTRPNGRWTIVADDLAHTWQVDWRSELARARDAAIAKSEHPNAPDAVQRARDLAALADALNVSLAHQLREPQPERKAA